MLAVIAPGAQILVLVDAGIPRMTSVYDNYPDNMEAYGGLYGGPFDLSDATDARMTFYFRGRTELNHDWFFAVSQVIASIMVDIVFRGVGDMKITRGNDWRKWYKGELSLRDLCRDSTVWMAFVSAILLEQGRFVDNVKVEKYTLRVSVSETPESWWNFTGNSSCHVL